MGGLPITMTWGDGEHRFALPLGRLRELQEKTGAGPLKLFNRIRSGDWLVDDLRETIRLGLIGGGMAPDAAFALVRRYLDEAGGYLEAVPFAQAILLSAMTAPRGVQSPNAEAPIETPDPTTASTSALSTEAASASA
jgi:hypothetical protein